MPLKTYVSLCLLPSSMLPPGRCVVHVRMSWLQVVALSKELILTLLGLREHGGVFGRFPKIAEQRIELQTLIAAKTAFDCRLHETGSKSVPTTHVVVHRETKPRLRIVKYEHVLLGLS